MKNNYKFDYILVGNYDKLYDFIKTNSDYELVYEGENKITLDLFQTTIREVSPTIRENASKIRVEFS